MRRYCAQFGAVLFLLFGAMGTVAADNPPGLMYSTLLNGVKMDYRNGNFSLDRIQATFLPAPSVKSNTIYPYNPSDGGKLWAVLSTTDGVEVARYNFYAQSLKPPFWLLNSHEVTIKKTGEKPPSGRFQLAKGGYSLEFFVEGKCFYKFPLQVDVVSSSSDFDPGKFYFLDGDWSNWGYFYYLKADPKNQLQWKVWLRIKGREKYKDVKVDVEVKRGSTVVCTSRPNTTHSLRPNWTRLEFDMIFPMKKTSGGAYFKAKDLLNTPGSYTLTMAIDGKPYGEWKFSIADGKFQPAGRTVRGKADSLTFVEGGIDAFWFAKEK